MINTNLPPILHCFRDIAIFQWVQNRYLWIPLLRLNAPTEGFPWDDLHKIFDGCQWIAKVPNGVEQIIAEVSTG